MAEESRGMVRAGLGFPAEGCGGALGDGSHCRFLRKGVK